MLTASVTILFRYQYAICPFCCRVKAYMDYNNIKYSVVEVNPLTKSELGFSKEYKKVPVANIDGEIIGDSSSIISKLRSMSKNKAVDESLFTPDTEKWMEWSEKKLAVMLYPNFTRNFTESWEAFAYASNVDSWGALAKASNRTIGPLAMYLANGKIKKKYGIVDERAELRTVLAEWTSAIKDRKFLHGEKVTMPDLMVYGVLHAIAGFTTFNEIMAENAELRDWYVRVDSAIRAA